MRIIGRPCSVDQSPVSPRTLAGQANKRGIRSAKLQIDRLFPPLPPCRNVI
jgi:hypothetical protein